MAMQASGSALRAQHERQGAIGRLYRFGAANCQSAPDLAEFDRGQRQAPRCLRI
jgi:hypothetical protein